jgi:hypothetical protein
MSSMWKVPPSGLTPHQRADHIFGQRRHLLAHARRSCALPAVDRDERLGHRDRDLRRLETDHGAPLRRMSAGLGGF